MALFNDGKIQPSIDPWLFDGMKDVFASCRYLHSPIIHLPDSKYWDCHDLEKPTCPDCGGKMDAGGRPSWILTSLPFYYPDLSRPTFIEFITTFSPFIACALLFLIDWFVFWFDWLR